MNIILILLIILFILMIFIGGKRGMQSFFTLILIAAKIDPIKTTFVGAIVISFFSLFFLNGFNRKTLSSLMSVIIAILLVMVCVYKTSINSNIQGFSSEQTDLVSFYNLYVQLNFSKIVVCEVLIGLLGAIIDVSISISSSMNELYNANPQISTRKLFISGMNIGKDILGTMTNTLFFAYISSFMTLMIYFKQLHYSLSTIINAKVFCSEFFQSICCGIGIVLIIPLTAFISSNLVKYKKISTS
ncbi:MAG: YibE/F family protein [Clostridium butyricum]|nr:YibE/F family protein [Clostridium butyricum]